MKKETVENIIRHALKKTPYKVTYFNWHSWMDEVEEGVFEDNTEVVAVIDGTFNWEKLNKVFTRLENKLNRKYGIMLDIV